jgi:hypothetical protein
MIDNMPPVVEAYPLFFHKDNIKHNLHYNVVVVVPMPTLLVVWKPIIYT